ncbi:3159_t:CDS:2 [Entrophospora sp. SA101]|nr:3159_t:CDS:2 [Entrophospora sp. SA101]
MSLQKYKTTFDYTRSSKEFPQNAQVNIYGTPKETAGHEFKQLLGKQHIGSVRSD